MIFIHTCNLFPILFNIGMKILHLHISCSKMDDFWWWF